MQRRPHRPRTRDGTDVSPKTARVAEQVGVDIWLTHTQVLEILGISKPTLGRMRQSGDFPAPIRIPGTRSIAWPAGQVRAWMAEQARKADARLLGP